MLREKEIAKHAYDMEANATPTTLFGENSMALTSARKRKLEQEDSVALPTASCRRQTPAAKEEAAFPGAALIDAIQKKADSEDMKPREVAALLGISPAHYSFLTTGRRRVAKLDDEVLRAAAEFLGKPLVEVDHLAEKRKLEDYYFQGDLEERLDKIHEFMRADPIYGSLCLSKKMWGEIPTEAKVLIGTMYETHARTNLLPRPKLRPIVHE